LGTWNQMVVSVVTTTGMPPKREKLFRRIAICAIPSWRKERPGKWNILIRWNHLNLSILLILKMPGKLNFVQAAIRNYTSFIMIDKY
jgi:hypothetical protein